MNKKYAYNKDKDEFTKEMLSDTLKYQKQYGFKMGENNSAHNNESDAFRHAYMQSLLALRYGTARAKGVSKLHEYKGSWQGQDPREANMDLWNNQQGQQIYNEIRREYPNFNKLSEQQQKDIIAQKVVQEMKEGKLITGLDDQRKFKKQKPTFTPMPWIGGFQNNGKPLGFATPVDFDHVFTPKEISEMSGNEFERNEQAIYHQARQGLIKSKPQQRNFSGYTNPISGDNKIFTRETISEMSDDEYAKNEKAIHSQLNSIGIPTNNEMANSTGTVYVNSYTRSDGTQVKGYYRSK